MKKAILAVLLLLATTGRAGAQGVDSCLTLWGLNDPDTSQRGNYWWNPDSVMVDTCEQWGSYPLIPDSVQYSKRYELFFKYAVIILSAVSPDSTLIVPWTQVDTAYPQFRSLCDTLASMYGGVWFIKTHPSDGDSSAPSYNDFTLLLGNYVSVDSFEHHIGNDFPVGAASVLGDIGYDIPTYNGVIYVQPETPAEPYKVFFLDRSELTINGITRPADYTIYDALGQILSSGRLAPGSYIDMSNLASGFYFLRVDGEVNQSFKIIK